jgi:hypothetical protein
LTKSIFLFFLSFILFISCDKQEDANLNTSNTNSVKTNVALDIAQSFFKSNTTGKGSKKSKTIDNIKVHKTKKNENAFYVINYKEGGFLVISADNRITPILAFSDTGSFSSVPTEIIPPVQEWMEEEKKQIQNVIDRKLPQSKQEKLEWEGVTGSNNSRVKNTTTTNKLPEPPSNTDCPDINIIKGPLLATIWDQWGNGFNNLIPYDCPYNPGGKAPTGCVATAIAQVMRYFHKPNTYNWSNMPNDKGTYDTQLLMKNIGESVKMKYYCDGSYTNAGSIAPAFINFGYSSAILATYDPNIVIQNINSNKPVILTGTNTYSGHAWVCDGYMKSTIYFKDDYGNCTGQGVTYPPLLYMNWGWGGSNNAYFSMQNFNPGTTTYNDGRSMIYNITL